MINIKAYKVGQTLEMRPASPKREWMDDSVAKNPYRCLPLNIANSFGWEFINPSKFSLEWNGGKGPKDVILKREAGVVFPHPHFGEGTFTWHTGYMFRTEYPYAMYVMGPPNFPKSNVIALSGIVETFWIPFTFTMNWRFTQPGKVDFYPGDVVCQVFPIDISMFDNVNPEVHSLSDNPELEEQYWNWSLARNAFMNLKSFQKTRTGASWQKDYLRGTYAKIDETTGCPFNSPRSKEEAKELPHKSKMVVPEFKIVNGAPYHTPPKYVDIQRKIAEDSFKKPEEPVTNDVDNSNTNIKTENPTMSLNFVTTKENTLPDIAEKINATEKLLLVYVTTKNDCDNDTDTTNNQQNIESTITNSFADKVEFTVLCVPANDMPFPKIETDVLYYFAPKNQTPLFFRERHIILQDLAHDIETGIKMMSTGTSYYDAKFDETTRNAIARTESYLKEDTTKFPSAFKMARNLAKEVWRTSKNAAKGLPVLVPAEVGISRYSTCEICEHLDSANFRCTQCGCFMKTKTQLASASCPVGKWGEYTG